MAPQPGSYSAGPGYKVGRKDDYASRSTGKSCTPDPDMYDAHPRTEEPRKDKKRKMEFAGRLGKEIGERRDDGRHFSENIAALHNTSHMLCTRPDMLPLYNLRLYPISLERSAILNQLEIEEKNTLDGIQMAYEEERENVEDEFKRGRERVRERLLEGIEERRRKAREEKEGEGIIGDTSLDSQSRPPTRKLRNKVGGSPPPTPMSAFPAPLAATQFTNPHSLNVDELPSPFPLPLTSTTSAQTASRLANGMNQQGAPNGSLSVAGATAGKGAVGVGGSRRKPKGAGLHPSQAVGGLGKSIAMLAGGKDAEIESDLGEIRRGNKRRRAANKG